MSCKPCECVQRTFEPVPAVCELDPDVREPNPEMRGLDLEACERILEVCALDLELREVIPEVCELILEARDYVPLMREGVRAMLDPSFRSVTPCFRPRANTLDVGLAEMSGARPVDEQEQQGRGPMGERLSQ